MVVSTGRPLPCGRTNSRPPEGGALVEIDEGSYRAVLRPAVGDGERRKLVGCLEDFTIERVRGSVQSFREVPIRTPAASI